MLRLAFLLAFLAANAGTHEMAMAQHDWVRSMSSDGGHLAQVGTPACLHSKGGKAASGSCCLAGPCKLALPWRDPPPSGQPLPVPRFTLRGAAPAEALPAAPWRPPA